MVRGGTNEDAVRSIAVGARSAKITGVTTTTLRGLFTAALALLAAGCYSAECVKMGYAEGTPQHARCVHHLSEEMTEQLNKLSEQLNKSSQQMKKKTASR